MNNQEQINQLIEAGDKATRDGLTWDDGDFYDDNEAVDPIFHKELFCFFALAANTREAVKAMEADNERMREALEEIACLGNHGRHGNSDGNMIAIQALKGKDDE